jgi:putative spermidine/putrescine transport system substrate-binding protein
MHVGRKRGTGRLLAAGAAALLLVAGCGGGGDDDDAGAGAPDEGATPGGEAFAGPVGDGEGQLSVLAWPGYAEDGSTAPDVDWVTPFEDETGCQVDVKVFATSNEAVQLFQTGQYDVVSASGDASLRLVYGEQVQPVNTDLVPNYADIIPGLKDQPWNTVGDTNYGVPHGRGANLLLFPKAEYPTPPDSWRDMFEADSPLQQQVSPYGDAIYIADAAVYLMATQPDLGITNPYALDQQQFDAAVALLEQQKPLVHSYWTDLAKQGQDLASGAVKQSQGWQLTANFTNSTAGDVIGTVKPKEGTTGWSDTWMIKKDTERLNCSYLWLDHITSPEVQAQIAEYFGEAPANVKACALTENEDHCAEFHAEETEYWEDVWYWTTPTEQCLDGRTDVTCVAYDEWVKAWSTLTSA